MGMGCAIEKAVPAPVSVLASSGQRVGTLLLALSWVCNFFQQPDIKAAFCHGWKAQVELLWLLQVQVSCVCTHMHVWLCVNSSDTAKVGQPLAIRECGRRVQSVLTFKMM